MLIEADVILIDHLAKKIAPAFCSKSSRLNGKEKKKVKKNAGQVREQKTSTKEIKRQAEMFVFSIKSFLQSFKIEMIECPNK